MKTQKTGFTLLELLVVIASIAMLTVTLLPALAGTRQNAQVIQCLSNLKQLQLGWIMFAGDNQGTLPQNIAISSGFVTDNPLANNFQPGQKYACWILGDVIQAPQWTNDLLLTHGQIYEYVNSVKVYECPADSSPRCRSYSMNDWMNGIAGWSGTQPVNWSTRCRTFTKITAFNLGMGLGPSKALVLLDENPASINDGYWLDDPSRPNTWYDLPAHYHNGGGNMSFADGHAGYRRWTDTDVLTGKAGGATGVAADPNSPDCLWMQQRESVVIPR